jgi:hypothetical protein
LFVYVKQMAIFDRLAIGDQLMQLHWPDHEEGLPEPMSADDAVEEFQEGMIASRNSGGIYLFYLFYLFYVFVCAFVSFNVYLSY